MRSILSLVFFALSAAGVSACEEDSKTYVTVPGISTPEVKPKVESATPSNLNGATLRLLEEGEHPDPATSLRSRIFSDKGPTAIFSLLEAVDAGMNAIEKRIQGAEKGPDEDPDAITSYAPCMGEIVGNEFVEKAGAAFAVEFDFDKDGTVDFDPGFTTYLNCYDDLSAADGVVPTKDSANPDSTYWRAFGRKGTGNDEMWYIVEGADPGASNASAGASAIAVSKALDYVDMWFRVGKAATAETQSGVLAHLRRNVSGTIEYTHTGKGVGFGCGLHALISKSAGLAFIRVRTDQETNGQQNDEGVAEQCDEFTGARNQEYCIDVSSATFSVKTSTADCTTAGLSTADFALTTLDYNVVTYANTVNTFNSKVPTGTELLYIESTPEKSE